MLNYAIPAWRPSWIRCRHVGYNFLKWTTQGPLSLNLVPTGTVDPEEKIFEFLHRDPMLNYVPHLVAILYYARTCWIQFLNVHYIESIYCDQVWFQLAQEVSDHQQDLEIYFPIGSNVKLCSPLAAILDQMQDMLDKIFKGGPPKDHCH